MFVCRDIHLNPTPKRNRSCSNFSIFHWNLNSITTHHYKTINLLEAFKFDMICISKSYLDSSISSNSEQLNIEELVRNDHPGNVRRGGVCTYFREFLPVRCTHFFFISYTFISTPGWNWQKIKQMLSNTLRLNFCYLKIIHILHSRYCLKIIGHILKISKRTSLSWDFTINHNKKGR